MADLGAVGNYYTTYNSLPYTVNSLDSYGVGIITNRQPFAVENPNITTGTLPTYYDLRGWDTTQWVFWTDTNFPPTLNPTVTSPTAVGAITQAQIIGVRNK